MRPSCDNPMLDTNPAYSPSYDQHRLSGVCLETSANGVETGQHTRQVGPWAYDTYSNTHTTLTTAGDSPAERVGRRDAGNINLNFDSSPAHFWQFHNPWTSERIAQETQFPQLLFDSTRNEGNAIAHNATSTALCCSFNVDGQDNRDLGTPGSMPYDRLAYAGVGFEVDSVEQSYHMGYDMTASNGSTDCGYDALDGVHSGHEFSDWETMRSYNESRPASSNTVHATAAPGDVGLRSGSYEWYGSPDTTSHHQFVYGDNARPATVEISTHFSLAPGAPPLSRIVMPVEQDQYGYRNAVLSHVSGSEGDYERAAPTIQSYDISNYAGVANVVPSLVDAIHPTDTPNELTALHATSRFVDHVQLHEMLTTDSPASVEVIQILCEIRHGNTTAHLISACRGSRAYADVQAHIETDHPVSPDEDQNKSVQVPVQCDWPNCTSKVQRKGMGKHIAIKHMRMEEAHCPFSTCKEKLGSNYAYDRHLWEQHGIGKTTRRTCYSTWHPCCTVPLSMERMPLANISYSIILES
ncbi:hypothetical protein DAEQUDRAFT_69646 [Daedalea quercina L-15889]|uniref:Uncharacterized protein n=1 Tax=Daedalea quercina L-15889 TaxID=1314783 RepID=A0A165L6G6_9APHY|nr:hypothetical protein DAEQUDRAFT_69646 [Daedalea quercina L-15889]